MRDLESARRSWQDLKQYRSLPELREAVRLDGAISIATAGCRSACWKSFLLFENLDTSAWSKTLQSARSAYTSLRFHFLGQLENVDEGGDPLTESAESPSVQVLTDEELRGEILQDVVRCMPENLYFRQPDTQRMLLDILFIYCKLNPDVSYRQGMHELLAPILWVVERDAIEVGQGSKVMGEDALISAMFDADHIEHDTFALFGQVMQNAKNFYEQTTVSGKDNPIVARSQRIFKDMLAQIDHRLSKHLESIDIVPQIFLMRWIRLLFGREFGFNEMLTVWDVIFAEDATLEIVDHICLAMLLRIRWQLIEADYNDALTLLLHYPAVEKDFAPQAFVLDAIYLRDHMNPKGGNYLVVKYTGRPLKQDGRPVTPPALQRNITAFSGGPTRQARNIESVLQSTAKNIYARGEKLGIGKVVRSAVDEVHKRAQEIRDTQTPSPPATWRQKGIRPAIAPSALHSRVKALEERNKQLSALLEGALNELWEYQRNASQGDELDDDDSKARPDVDALSVAIAKVQFVQVYLDDPNLPLPEQPSDSSETNDPIKQPTEDMSQDTEADLASSGPVEAVENSAQPASVPATAPNARSLVAGLADPSSFEDVSISSSRSQTPVPAIILHGDKDMTGQEQESTKGASTPRPRLEQSSFSWMLDSNNKFDQPSVNVSSEQIGKTLFGDNASSRSSKSRPRPSPARSDAVPTNDAAFDLGSLRHGKARNT